MSLAIIAVNIFILMLIIPSVKVINENQRAVVFRLGKLEKVVGPGMVVIVPHIDRLFKVDLNSKIPGWQGLSPEQLNDKVKEVALQEFK